MPPYLSVIIPTHKRADILARCLTRLEEQTVRDQLEVIVVSDGHDEKTTELFAKKSWRIPVKFLEIEKSQQGVARNRGVKEAKGDYVLFIGDDILLAPSACEMHLKSHEALRTQDSGLKTTILGHTTWDPSLEITPVMKWLETSGWQFGYPLIEKYVYTFLPQNIQADFTYTSHISLPATVARKHPFREDVLLYGWEDVEWGMRLRDDGVRIFYEPSARGFHFHELTPEESLKRMETLGTSLVRMANAVPEFKKKLTPWKLMISRLLSFFPTIDGIHRRAFLCGIALGKK